MHTSTYSFLRSFKGFTLVELIITLAIAAILVTVAIPSFQGVIRRNQITTQVNEFVSALNLARSEAITRGQRVTLCKSTNGTTCNTSNAIGWDSGWIVFVDADNDTTRDNGETILRVHGALEGNTTMTGNNFVDNYISYIPSGITRRKDGGFQNGTLTLSSASTTRKIVISVTGRVRTP